MHIKNSKQVGKAGTFEKSNVPAFFSFKGGIKLKNYEIKKAFKNLPDAGLPDNDTVTCREFEQCDGCHYPAHGFICWHGDGKCLRTEMREVQK